MAPKYFLRRSIAYLYDLIIVSAAFAVLALAINYAFSVNVVGPSLIKFSQCQSQQVVTAERINELLPLTGNQTHTQKLCKTTFMGISSFYTATITRSGKSNGTTSSQYLSFYVDEDGKQINVFNIDAFLWLITPLIFATMIAKRGRTYGKQTFDLIIFDEDHKPADFKTALKREYLKGLPLAIFALFELVTLLQFINYDLDEAAKLIPKLAEQVEATGFLTIALLVLALFLALFWYEFGSFIRWRGQSYWDRWTGLYVDRSDRLQDNTSMSADD